MTSIDGNWVMAVFLMPLRLQGSPTLGDASSPSSLFLLGMGYLLRSQIFFPKSSKFPSFTLQLINDCWLRADFEWLVCNVRFFKSIRWGRHPFTWRLKQNAFGDCKKSVWTGQSCVGTHDNPFVRCARQICRIPIWLKVWLLKHTGGR